MKQTPVSAFISYKWGEDEHNGWVERFAADLRHAGIDAKLDRWEVRFGDSFTDYMTAKIRTADVVLCIITDEYVNVVEGGEHSGGAAKFEMQMAAARRTAGEDVRLIGIYRQGSRPPIHLRDHRYADFRDDGKYKIQLAELIQDLLGSGTRPPLGAHQTSSSYL